jgi:sodium/bile acid cotransporter 7
MASCDSAHAVVDEALAVPRSTVSANVPAAKELANSRHACLGVLKSQLALILVLSSLALGVLLPGPGAKAYKAVKDPIIVVLFVAVGYVIPIKEFSKGAAALHLHLLCQVLCFIVLPGIYYLLVFRWGWATSMGILSEPFSIGVMTALCLPTTTTTCVLWVQKSKADDSLAAVNAVLGNLLGSGVSPLVASMFLGGETSGSSDLAATLWKLSYRIVAPTLVGLAAQAAVKRVNPELQSQGVKTAKHFMDLILFLLTYFIFASCFEEGADGMSVQTVGGMIVWVTIVHFFFLFFCYGVGLGLRLRLKQRIAVAFVCSQKTESMGLAILAIIFADAPDLALYTLPVAAYHTVQMIVAAALVGTLARWVEEEESSTAALEGKEEPILDEHIADAC